MAAGDPTAARTLYDQSLTIARRLAEADPGNVQLQRDLAMSYGKLGLVARSDGNSGVARRYFEDGRAIVVGRATVDPSNVQYRTDVATFDGEIATLENPSSDEQPTPIRVHEAARPEPEPRRRGWLSRLIGRGRT